MSCLASSYTDIILLLYYSITQSDFWMQPSKMYSTKVGGLQKADVNLKHNQASKMEV